MNEKIIKYIDYNNWYRKEFYEIFCEDSDPIFGVTSKLNVTNVYNFSKSNKISFYFSLGHCFMKALKEIEEYNIRMVDNKLAVLKNDFASFCCLNEDDKVFRFIDFEYNNSMECFAKAGMKINYTQTKMSNGAIDGTFLAWFTCLPWFKYTHMTNPKSGDKLNFIPRICWDKIEDNNGEKFVNLTIEVNHRIIDGYLIGKLINNVQALIDKNEF